MTPAELLARLREAADRTGELDWSLVRDDFEIHDHELPDSAVHRGPEQLERTDAQLWTFSADRLVRMDYYPDYRGHEPPGEP